MSNSFKFRLGAKLRDVVTGVEGIATARVEYLTGCTQYGLAAKAIDNKPADTTPYFDEQRLIEIEGGIELPAGDVAGGPSDQAPRAAIGLR